MVNRIIVLGAGSAGLLTAITLKRKISPLQVRIIRSPEIGVIGVGESTTPQFPRHLFEYLQIKRRHFYTVANPTWKMGIHFLWGPRQSYEYAFEQGLDAQWRDLPKANGYYCNEDLSNVSLSAALMSQGKAFTRNSKTGAPEIPPWAAFHLYNPQLVTALEAVARDLGCEIMDGKAAGTERGPAGIAAVILEDGRRLEADLFVDASGFRSELLGRALAEPFISFSPSLFCDRAVVGSWDRGNDFIWPYTVAETMDAGWCWQIDHENAVNRGYVYSSRFISDDQAHAEFIRKNPKAKTWNHVVRYRSGRYQRAWVDNVVGIGNACGFVEPLEATALMVVCASAQNMVDFLLHSNMQPTDTMRDLYNRASALSWDDVRNFLAIHYRFNTRLDTPFWQTCRAEADVSAISDLLTFYAENGPSGLCRHYLNLLPATQGQFGIEGYLVHLVGNRVPYKNTHIPTESEWRIWRKHQQDFRASAANGVTVKEALQYIRHPNWKWSDE